MREISGDLVLKVAVGVAAIGALVWAARRVSDAAGKLGTGWWNTATDAAWSFSPTNPNNAFAAGVNAGVSAATGRDETLGGWLYDLTHRDPMKDPLSNVSGDVGSGVDASTGQTISWGLGA